MKKMIFFAVFVCLIAGFACAQSYTVQELTGRVERESGNQRVALKAGDSLTADTVIHTGVGSTLVLRSGDRTYTVQAVRSGKVSELTNASSGIRISGNVTRVDTAQVDRTTGQVSTASARASEAAAGDDIAAE